MKAVIFDMDGVIIDSEPIHLYVDQLVLKNVIGMSVTLQYLERYVGVSNPEMWRDIIQQHRLHHTVEELIEHQRAMKMTILNETDIAPIHGISELIQSLSDHGIPLGVASSSPRQFIEAVLTKFSMKDSFISIASGEEVEHGKPAPDVYQEVARLMGISAHQCVAIEDSRHGVMAAKRAGMKCIGFQNMNSGEQDLSFADHVVGSIHEITLDVLSSL